jgi:hypothetical protein
MDPVRKDQDQKALDLKALILIMDQDQKALDLKMETTHKKKTSIFRGLFF